MGINLPLPQQSTPLASPMLQPKGFLHVIEPHGHMACSVQPAFLVSENSSGGSAYSLPLLSGLQDYWLQQQCFFCLP